MRQYLLFLLIDIIYNIGAWGQNQIEFIRFDSLMNGDLTQVEQSPAHTTFAGLLAKGVLGLPQKNGEQPVTQLAAFYHSHHTLEKLYQDTQIYFSQEGKASLDSAMFIVRDALLRLPEVLKGAASPKRIYYYVSAMHEKLVVAEDLMGIALDRYLGEEYPIYKQLLTVEERQRSTLSHLATDALLGWILSEYPKESGQLRTLGSELRYWGEVYDILHRLLPDYSEKELFGYTDAQYSWLRKNVRSLYKSAEEQLSSPHIDLIDSYFGDIKNGELPIGAPHQVGRFLGYWMLQEGLIEEDTP